MDRKACLALIHNAEKAAQVETGMHLLHALLAGDLRPHACTLISHSFGLEVNFGAMSFIKCAWAYLGPE